MRYLPLALWASSTLVMVLIVLSDFAFSDSADVKLTGKRLALALVWPLAAMSRRGREVLFNTGRGL